MNVFIGLTSAVISMIILALIGFDVLGTIIFGIIVFIIGYLAGRVWDWITKHLFR